MSQPLTEEDVALVRDAMLGAYVSRKPQAVPHPDTSLYAVLEATATVIASIAKVTPGAMDLIAATREVDKAAPIKPPEVEEAFNPELKDRNRDGAKPIPQPPPEAQEGDTYNAELGEWECAANGEGAF